MNTTLIQNQNIQEVNNQLSRLLATGTVKQEQISELLTLFSAQIVQQVQSTVHVAAAAPHIFEALSNMQKEVSETGIAKTLKAMDKDGKELYKARGIDAVYNLLSPLFANHGITLGIDCLENTKQSVQVRNSIQHQINVKVKYTFISMKDASSHSITMFGEAYDYGDKGLAKALSMAFKYACFQMLCIPVCDDADATVHEKAPANNYQTSQWSNNNAHSNQQQNQGFNPNNSQRPGNTNQHNSNNGQSFNNSNQGNDHSHSNNGQNNNAQNPNETITEQQANLLLGKLNAAGADPRKILHNHKIQNLGQLTMRAFEGLVRRLDTHLNEQQLMNQHQGNYS